MRASVLITVAALVFLPSCAGPQRRAAETVKPTYPGADDLKGRAEQLWTARRAEDWNTVFRFEDPQRRQEMVQAEFVTWCQENEPFRVHAFEVKRVQTDGPLGWVELDCRTSVRQFPKMPPRDLVRWEKWRIVDGQWYPVPRRGLKNYPDAPARRDAAAEARLSKRFEQSCQARCAGDWERVYEMTDPRDREHVTREQFVEKESIFQHVACDVQWVEVVGNRGRVRVLYKAKLNDPSMTKLPPQATYATERWIEYEDNWYLDLGAQRQ